MVMMFCAGIETLTDVTGRQSNGDGEVCPEVSVKEEGQGMVMVRNWLSSCAHYRIGNPGLTVLLCVLD